MGNSAFKNMTEALLANPAVRIDHQHSITEESYEAWRREFTFEGIRGARYGQSFCNHFNITDYVLFYKIDWASADQHIRTVYLEKP